MAGGLGYWLAALTACGNAGSGTGPVDGSGTACDTETPPATTGGSHGPPFEFAEGADETGGDDGGTGVLPPAMGDPTGWQYNSQYGIYYRGTTEDERSDNRWHEGSLLVVDADFLADALSGTTRVDLHVPLALAPGDTPTSTLAVERIFIEKRRTSSQAPLYSAEGSSVTVRRPVFYSYFPYEATQSEPGNAIVHLVAEQGRGFYGTVGLEDRRVAVRGPFVETTDVTRIDIDPPVGDEVILVETSIVEEPWFFVQVPAEPTDLTAAAGQAAAPVTVDGLVTEPWTSNAGASGRTLQCADGLDNDPDERADNCDYDCLPHPDYGGNDIDHVRAYEYGKSLAMLPDTSFCTCAPLPCAATLMQVGEGAAYLLNALQPPPSMDYTLDTKAPPIRVLMLAELVHGDGCDAAYSCDASGMGCEADYPFDGANGDPSDMRPLAWEGVTLAATEIANEEDVHPVSLVGVVASSISTSDAGVGGYDPVNGFLNLGAAVIRFDFDDDDQDTDLDVAFNANRLAHELGHCFGLRHDDAIATAAGSNFATLGFMNDPPGPLPILGGNESGTEFIEDKTNWEIWATLPWDPGFPRAGGFGHTGCNDHADCQTPEFPNMVCVGSGEETFCNF